MNITEVKIRKVESEGKIKAMASITIDGCFVVGNMKIIQGDNGLFIAMPSRKTPDGEYKDICFPVTKEARQYINNMVLAKYNGLEPVGEIPDCPECGLPVEQCECSLPF
jgi:stage V sporulation protein G